MEDYILEIDSSQRDPNIYSDPNDYTVYLNKHIYNAESISLVTGKIPVTQTLINRGNKQFQIDDVTIVLDEKNYSNGHILASDLQTALQTTNVNSVTYTSNTSTLLFQGSDPFSFKFYSGSNGYSTNSEVGTPFNVLGLPARDTEFSTQLESGHLDFLGPTNLIIKITVNDEECMKDVYSYSNNHMNSTYTGRLMMFRDNPNNMLDFKPGDPVQFRFFKGTDKFIDNIRIQWFYNVGNKLIPYNFRGRNHFIKIKIRGSLDKLNVLPRIESQPEDQEESTGHEAVEEHKSSDLKYYITLGILIILVIFIWSRHK